VRQRYFDEHTLLREVVSHKLTALSGPRALLVMAAHPVAFAGFFAHTGALADPYGRLRRTGRVMDAVAFGTAAQAERMTAPVRAMHARVRGVLPEDTGRFAAGTPYRGDDPALLLWILAALAESAMLVFPRYVRSLTREELNELWLDYREVGRCFGLRSDEMPADIDAFEAYMAAMYASGDLYVSARARELALDIVLRPDVPLQFKPVVELVNQVTVGLLPAGVRRLYGFRWDPLRAAVLRSSAELIRRLPT
jgi:uncharacterized protein (DUF2236 family)